MGWDGEGGNSHSLGNTLPYQLECPWHLCKAGVTLYDSGVPLTLSTQDDRCVIGNFPGELAVIILLWEVQVSELTEVVFAHLHKWLFRCSCIQMCSLLSKTLLKFRRMSKLLGIRIHSTSVQRLGCSSTVQQYNWAKQIVCATYIDREVTFSFYLWCPNE